MEIIENGTGRLRLTLFSFGFKHGHPEADLVWDVRFLPNPYWVPDLKEYSGLEEEVARYVLENEAGQEFLRLVEPLLEFMLTHHRQSRREALRLAIGCTGGRHRSVAVTEYLGRALAGPDYCLEVFHRDIDKR
ncbi:RapZ C-terminal domain-containing protein [Desulfolithobacter sp.]